MTRAGPVDELIAKTPDWRRAMLAKLRKIVHDADPEIAEDVKWKRPSNPLGSAVWSHDGMVCVGIILKERVRLSFSAGSSLPDPKKLFNAQLLGKSRAIDVSQNEKLDEQALKAIVKAAVGHNLAKTRPAKTRARSRSTKWYRAWRRTSCRSSGGFLRPGRSRPTGQGTRSSSRNPSRVR